MSRPKVIGVLNRLLANVSFSLIDYLSESSPWTHTGNEPLVEALRVIVVDHDYHARRLAEAIEERDGCIDSSTFPTKFTSLNDLALDYLFARVLENQEHHIQATEQCVAELVEDPPAWGLASEVLRSERAHLDILRAIVVVDAAGPRDTYLQAATMEAVLDARGNKMIQVTAAHHLRFDQDAKAYRTEEASV
jgi:hypothetical protein